MEGISHKRCIFNKGHRNHRAHWILLYCTSHHYRHHPNVGISRLLLVKNWKKAPISERQEVVANSLHSYYYTNAILLIRTASIQVQLKHCFPNQIGCHNQLHGVRQKTPQPPPHYHHYHYNLSCFRKMLYP